MTIEVYSPRFRNMLSSLFLGKAGGGGSVLQVLDDVLPVVQVVDPAQGEFHLPRGEVPFLCSFALVGAAGSYASIKIRPSQGFIVALESIRVYGVEAAGDIKLAYIKDAAGLYPGNAVNAADTRYGPWAQDGYVAGINADVTASATTGIGIVLVPGSIGMLPLELLTQDYILCNPMPPPNPAGAVVPGLQISGPTLVVGSRLTVAIGGYARLAEPAELTSF